MKKMGVSLGDLLATPLACANAATSAWRSDLRRKASVKTIIIKQQTMVPVHKKI